MSFDYLFSYLVSLTVFIPFCYCLLARKKKVKVVNTIWILLGIDILIAIIIEFYNQAGSRTSIVYFNIYPLFQFIMVSIIYTYLIPHWKKWIYVLIPVYTIFFVVNALWIEDIKTIQNYPLFAQSIIIVGYCGLHYRFIYKTIEREPPLFNYGPFWINTAFFCYFLFSVGLFFVANKILTELEPSTARLIWNVHGLNYIIKNVSLSIGIRQIHKAEEEGFPYTQFRVKENWREHMKPNPNLDQLEAMTGEDVLEGEK